MQSGLVVSACWLHDQLASDAAEVLVIEAGVTDAESDLVIPSSIFVNMELWEGPTGAGIPLVEGSGNLLPPVQLQPLVEQAGIHCNTRVVVYSHNSTKALNHAPIVGARLLWALRYAGVHQAVLLDGGLSSWLREGYPTVQSNQRPLPVPVDDFFDGDQQLEFPMQPELCASTEEVEKAVSGQLAGAVLGDVRSWEEFTGQRHSYTYFDSLGRIPDARCVPLTLHLMPASVPLTLHLMPASVSLTQCCWPFLRGAAAQLVGGRWARWGDSTYIGGDLWSGSADQSLIDAHKVRLAWEGAAHHPPVRVVL